MRYLLLDLCAHNHRRVRHPLGERGRDPVRSRRGGPPGRISAQQLIDLPRHAPEMEDSDQFHELVRVLPICARA